MPDSTTPTTLAEKSRINFYAEMEPSDEEEGGNSPNDLRAQSLMPTGGGTGSLGPAPSSGSDTVYVGYTYTIDPEGENESDLAKRRPVTDKPRREVGVLDGSLSPSQDNRSVDGPASKNSGQTSLVYTPGKEFVPTHDTATAQTGDLNASLPTNMSKIESDATANNEVQADLLLAVKEIVSLYIDLRLRQTDLYDHYDLPELEEKHRRVMVISFAGNGSKYSTRIRDAGTFAQLYKKRQSAGTEAGTGQIWELTNGAEKTVEKDFRQTTCDDTFLSALNVPVEKVFESVLRALSLNHKVTCRFKLQAVEQRSLHSGTLIGKADVSCILQYHNRCPEVVPAKRFYNVRISVEFYPDKQCYKSA